MLNIWTTTWSRPDLVQMLADAISVTATVEYRFNVVVQRGGLRRSWRSVHDVIDGDGSGTSAWVNTVQLAGPGEHIHLHDDCLPMRSWTTPPLPCARSVGGGAIGSSFIAWRGPWSPFAGKLPAPRARLETMPDWWPDDVRSLAEQSQCEVLLGGDFLHLDKSTIHHPSSPYNTSKPILVLAICRHLGIDPPEPLTAAELAFQRGWNPPTVHRLPDEDGGAAQKQLASPPSLVTKVRNFAFAAVKHVAAGMPLASDAERERRFAICQQCEHFDGSACRKCGCGVSRERAYVSKLSWATSTCPVGKWGPESA